MGQIKGAMEWNKFKAGMPLTRKQAILAQCYECNGYESEDCLGVSCPLYQWSPFNKSGFQVREKRKNYGFGMKNRAIHTPKGNLNADKTAR